MTRVEFSKQFFRMRTYIALGLIAVILIPTAGLIEGVAAFGWHPVLTPTGIISPGVALSRIVLATFYVAWSLTGIIAIAFFMSVATDATLGSVAGGFGMVII